MWFLPKKRKERTEEKRDKCNFLCQEHKFGRDLLVLLSTQVNCDIEKFTF